VQLVRTPLDGVPKAGVTNVGLLLNTTFVVPVEDVTPVPPLATARVPARVTAPVVVVLGVNPVVPAEKELTIAAGAVLAQVVPLDVNKFPEVLGATASNALVPFPIKTLFKVREDDPVPPSATARSVIPVIVPPVIVAELVVIDVKVAVPAEIDTALEF
jgi:hypothetical protein